MKMREEHSRERKLKVRWTTEQWIPAIQRVVASKRSDDLGLEVLADLPPMGKRSLRKRRQVLWVRGAGRFSANGLPGLNGPRTTWR
jgi:hypothetical protein